MTDLVTVTITDHVADVRLNRPDKMNALSLPLLEAVTATAEQLMRNRDVRAIVLSGEGRAFCAGLDLSNFTNPETFGGDAFGKGRGGYWPNYYQKPGYVWKDVPVPVICALHGVVFGGGLQIALGADIRIAHPETRLSLMEIRWGLIPDMSATQTLRDLVRLDVAKELAFTGRIVEAPEAQQMGLVTRLDEHPREAALALARNIARQNPQAVTLGKLLFESAWHGPDAAGLELEERLQARLLMTPNQMEAVMAGMQKREPVFSPRSIDRLNRAQPLQSEGLGEE